MNIGEKILIFEETNCTLNDFNKIFNHSKIEDKNLSEKVLEIGEIVGTGKETIREVKIYTNDYILEKIIEHEFYPKISGRLDKAERNLQKVRRRLAAQKAPNAPKPKQSWSYRAVDCNNKTIATANSMKVLAEKMGVSRETIRSRCYNPFSFNKEDKTKPTIKFNVQRKRRK